MADKHADSREVTSTRATACDECQSTGYCWAMEKCEATGQPLKARPSRESAFSALAKRPRGATLTRWRLRAICEALTARLAGEMDVDTIPRSNYQAALEWAEQELEKRQTRAIRPTRAKPSTRKDSNGT